MSSHSFLDSLSLWYSEIKSDVLYRRGGSYERIKNYEKADKIREKLLSMKIYIKDLEGNTVWDYNPD